MTVNRNETIRDLTDFKIGDSIEYGEAKYSALRFSSTDVEWLKQNRPELLESINKLPTTIFAGTQGEEEHITGGIDEFGAAFDSNYIGQDIYVLVDDEKPEEVVSMLVLASHHQFSTHRNKQQALVITNVATQKGKHKQGHFSRLLQRALPKAVNNMADTIDMVKTRMPELIAKTSKMALELAKSEKPEDQDYAAYLLEDWIPLLENEDLAERSHQLRNSQYLIYWIAASAEETATETYKDEQFTRVGGPLNGRLIQNLTGLGLAHAPIDHLIYNKPDTVTVQSKEGQLSLALESNKPDERQHFQRMHHVFPAMRIDTNHEILEGKLTPEQVSRILSEMKRYCDDNKIAFNSTETSLSFSGPLAAVTKTAFRNIVLANVEGGTFETVDTTPEIRIALMPAPTA